MSTGPALTDQLPAGTHAAAKAARGKTDSDFHHILYQADGKKHATGPQHAQDQAADDPVRQRLWPEFIGKFADSDGDPEKITADDADKSSDAGKKIDDGKVRHGDRHHDQMHDPQIHDPSQAMAALPGAGLEPARGHADESQAAPAAPTQNPADVAQPQPILGETEVDLNLSGKVMPTNAPLQPTKSHASETNNIAGQQDDGFAGLPADADEAGSPEPLVAVKAKPGSDGQTARQPSADKPASPAHVTVIGEQNFPAPAAYQSSTATSLAATIGGDGGLRQSLAASAGLAST
ncbi:MAG TPA: hypothetical protein VGM46_03720, partial [Mesorhizobium sp.]